MFVFSKDYVYHNLLYQYVKFADENDGRDVITIPTLESDRYGNKEGQTWFKNAREARRIFTERMNTFMSTLNWWDIDLFWESNSDEVYITQITMTLKTGILTV